MNLFDNNMRRVVTAAMIGNALETYDMVIYGFFAATIAQNFFPQQAKLTGIASAFALFFVGYLARPLGAFFLGRMGDTLGRKPALLLSISLMALSTCGVGLLPNYATIGMWAPILLLILRLLQGFSCGGELIGSMIFVVEHAPRADRGLYGSFAVAGSCSGLLLAPLIALLIRVTFSDIAVIGWAWRLPFLFGALIGWVGWFMRRRIPETELFQQSIRMPQYYLKIYREYVNHIPSAILTIGIMLFTCILSYLINVFLINYMSIMLHYTVRQALSVNIVSITLLVLLMPWVGKLSDRVGRRLVLKFAIYGCIIWIWPYFWLLQQQNIVLALFAQSVMNLFGVAYAGVTIVTSIEIVPTHLRFTLVALAYAVTLSLFGGMTPLVATLLLKITHSCLGLALLLLFCACISLFAVYKVRETKPKTMEQSIEEDIRQIIRNMLANGESVEQVAAVTGLSKIEVAECDPRYVLSNEGFYIRQ